jgi:hypothetical protein
MSSTYSTNLALELIGTGDQAGNWGSTTNTNLGTLLEQAISGYVTQAVATGTDTVITIPNGTSGVARNMFIELTGTGGASTNLIVPVNKKLYFIYNNSTGAVTVKVTGLTGVSVPAAAKMVLVSNGTDIVVATNYMAALTLGAALPVASGGTGSTSAATGTGGVVLAASPTLTGTPLAPTASPGTNTTQIATTAFVAASTGTLGTMSTQNANNVAITGGTITGLSSPLPLASGGTGGTTSTGSGAIVLASSATLSSPTLSSPTLSSPTFSGTPGSSLIVRMSSGGLNASGNTSVDFTSMPSWINMITVVFRNISTNGSSFILVQLGTSGGIATSGYVSTSIDFDGSGSATVSSTSGLILKVNGAGNVINGIMTIVYMGSNAWVNNHSVSTSTNIMSVGGGTIALGGTLDRVRITTVSGSDAFDAGSLNVLYQ